MFPSVTIEQCMERSVNSMSNVKKVWAVPVLQVLGDVQSLTQIRGTGPSSPGSPCPAPVKKGWGVGDTFSNSQNNDPNPSNGCNIASGF
jgi:hypothetical protein